MKSNKYLYLVSFIGIFSIVFSGCSYFGSTKHPESTLKADGKKEDLTIKTVTPRFIYFKQTHAHRDGDELVVWGRVRIRTKTAIAGGHVDIVVIDPAGKELYKISEYTTPKVLHKEDTHGAVFRVRLPVSPPVGSHIQLTFHKPEFSRSKPKPH